MFVISAIRSVEHYTRSGEVQYYTESGRCRGEFVGRGCARWGLSGAATEEQAQNLLDGKSPDGKRTLLRRYPSSRPGYDLCWTQAETFNDLWAVADPKRAKELEEALKKSVDAAFDYADREFALSRTGRGGVHQEATCGLVGVRYFHGSSRGGKSLDADGREVGDPLPHEHRVVRNAVELAAGPDDNGRTLTLDATHLYRGVHQHLLGLLQQVELDYQLRRLGVETYRPAVGADRDGQMRYAEWVEIAHMSEALSSFWSTRRGEILERAAAKGSLTAGSRQAAAYATRQAKDLSVTVEEAKPVYQAVAREFGVTPEHAESLFRRVRLEEDLGKRVQTAIDRAFERLEKTQAHFTKHDLLYHTADEALGQAIPAGLLVAAVEHRLEILPEHLRRGVRQGFTRYSTQKNYENEQAVLGMAAEFREKDRPLVSEETFRRVLSRKEWAGIKPEQRQTLETIFFAKGSLKLISGMAGTGKTDWVLDPCRELCEAAGFSVVGAAYTGKAASELRNKATIQATTIHRLLMDLEAAGSEEKRRIPRERVKLDAKTVLVLDECGQCPTDLLRRVLDKAKEAGVAAVILCGDEAQVQPIGAGNPFASLVRRYEDEASSPVARLTDVQRQKHRWMREVVYAAHDGRSDEALRPLLERELFTLAEDQIQARTAMISDWREQGGAADAKRHLMLAWTRAEVAELNRLAQEERLAAGLLCGGRPPSLETPHFSVGGQRFFVNDRVMLTRNNTYYGVCNGELATVQGIDPARGTATFLIDGRPRPVTLSLENYNRFGPAIELGYAVTTYKSQGSSIEHVYAMADFPDQEQAYVALSRPRESVRLYANEIDAGEDLAGLKRRMARSNRKDLFHDLPSVPSHELGHELTPER